MSDQPIIFVTGGTGHLGYALLPALLRAGFCVRALTRQPERHAWLQTLGEGLQIVRGDVTDAALIERAVQGCRYVVHAAAKFAFWGKHEQFERTNVEGAANVMRAALAAQVEKYVHISTVVVVGKPLAGRIVDETHPTDPVDPYQRSKLHAEQLALQAGRESGLPVVVLRPG
ncbi:MAG: NAD-dependent epimerase/dehydratase family protein, partial [Chloroflexota bacterium]